MNKQMLLAVVSLLITSISFGSLRRSSLRERSSSLRKSLIKKYVLSIPDRNNENNIKLLFTSRNQDLESILDGIATKLNHDRKNVRLRIDKSTYGKLQKKVNYSKPWFVKEDGGSYIDVKLLQQYVDTNECPFFYICKLKKNYLDFYGQELSYTKKYNHKKKRVVIKFNCKDLDLIGSCINNGVKEEIKDIFYLNDSMEDNYEFKFKNLHHIVESKSKNKENLGFKNIASLNLVFPTIKSGIKFLNNIEDGNFENNCIGKIEVQDIQYSSVQNIKMEKEQIIDLLQMLKNQGNQVELSL